MVYALNVRLDGKDITKEAIEKFVDVIINNAKYKGYSI